MEDLAELLKAVADPTRLRILRLLHEAKQELCGCELVDCLDEAQYNVSKHLRVLRQAGLITSRKDGQWVYHGLARGSAGSCALLLRLVAGAPDERFVPVRRKLARRLRMRTNGKCLTGSQRRHAPRSLTKAASKHGR